MAKKKLVYGIDDRPPTPILILAGAQHVLTLFGATTLVPLIFGPAMGMTTQQIGAFIGCVYFSMGIATLIQTHPKLGSGLPIVQGSSFSFIPPIMTIIGAYKSLGPDVIMQYVGGALFAGGLVLSLLGYSKLIGRIRKIITPVVIGPTIMAIGFSLAPTAIQFNAANFWPISLLVVAMVFFFSLVSKNKYFNIFAVLGSIVIAYLICLALSLSGVFAAGHPAYINLQSVYDAPWLRYKLFMPWGAPKFSGLAIGAIAAGFFCVMIESIGDYHNCSYAAGIDDPTPEQINRGIGAEGMCCALSGLLGSVGTTSYTENIGLIGLTGVASRHADRQTRRADRDDAFAGHRRRLHHALRHDRRSRHPKPYARRHGKPAQRAHRRLRLPHGSRPPRMGGAEPGPFHGLLRNNLWRHDLGRP